MFFGVRTLSCCFVAGRFVDTRRSVGGRFVSGRFVAGRFVGVSPETMGVHSLPAAPGRAKNFQPENIRQCRKFCGFFYV